MDFSSSRRVWVKRFMLGTVASMSLPKWAGVLLAEVEETMPDAAVVKLKVTDYPELDGVGGSIQLLFNQLTEPFTLNRVAAQEFVTLDSICTHQGCGVGPYSVSEGCMRCPCHGSRFDLEGRVFRDALGSTEPAPDDLNRFTTTYDEAAGIVSITIPRLALAVRSLKATPGAAAGEVKVQLRFPATAGSTYEISHQASLDGDWTVVPFSTNADGSKPTTSITPLQSGFITAHLTTSGSRGFFAVGLVLTPAVI